MSSFSWGSIASQLGGMGLSSHANLALEYSRKHWEDEKAQIEKNERDATLRCLNSWAEQVLTEKKSAKPKPSSQTASSTDRSESQSVSPAVQLRTEISALNPNVLSRIKELAKNGNKNAQTNLTLIQAAENGNAEGQYHLAVALRAGRGGLVKDLESARHWLTKSAEQGYSKAKLALRPATEKYEKDDPKRSKPDSASVWSHIKTGNDRMANENFDEAIAAYRMAVELDPKNAGAHKCLGVALEAFELPDEAITYYRKAIKLDPKDASARKYLGVALQENRQLRKLSEAIAAYRKAVELDPYYADAWLHLGDALRENDQLEDAIVAFREGIKLDPKDADAHMYIGAALRDNDQLNEAITVYRNAIQLEPENVYAHEHLGLALLQTGQYEKAIAVFRKAIELDPDDDNVWMCLGDALRENDLFEEAVVSYSKGIKQYFSGRLPDKSKTPQTVQILGNRTECLFEFEWDNDLRRSIDAFIGACTFHHNDQIEDGITFYRKSIEHFDGNTYAYECLGDALMETDKIGEAIISYQKALIFDPENVTALRSRNDALRLYKDIAKIIRNIRS